MRIPRIPSLATSLLLFFITTTSIYAKKCPKIPRTSCCTVELEEGCSFSRSCVKWINRYCPERRDEITRRYADLRDEEGTRRSPEMHQAAKCGTAERNYAPCTSKNIANKLFNACCQLYVPDECHFMCTYETDQSRTRNMLIDLVQEKRCSVKYLSSVLYCASQNRDNRKCCAHLDLNAPQLQVGSRCLRLCDPSGTSIDRITKDDVTCLYNWNVIMYCHHAGIREM